MKTAGRVICLAVLVVFELWSVSPGSGSDQALQLTVKELDGSHLHYGHVRELYLSTVENAVTGSLFDELSLCAWLYNVQGCHCHPFQCCCTANWQ